MDEPNYNITDSSGTVVGQIGVDANGNPVVSKPGGGSVVVTDDGVEIPGDASIGGSLSTGDLDTGRSWAKLESSRSFDTLYTNDTDSEIWVWVVVNIQADGTKVQLNMGNSSFAPGNDFRLTKTLDSGDFETFGPFVVPPDEEYEVANFSTSSGDVVIDRWSEFR